MKSAFFTFLLVPSIAFCEQISIAAGMTASEAKTKIRRAGGTDITPNLAVVGPKGGWPLKEVYWEFRDYDVVIELSEKEERIVALGVWSKKDFFESKGRREDGRQPSKRVTLDTEKKTVALEKLPTK